MQTCLLLSYRNCFPDNLIEACFKRVRFFKNKIVKTKLYGYGHLIALYEWQQQNKEICCTANETIIYQEFKLFGWMLANMHVGQRSTLDIEQPHIHKVC